MLEMDRIGLIHKVESSEKSCKIAEQKGDNKGKFIKKAKAKGEKREDWSYW
jgi:hypothetical protein